MEIFIKAAQLILALSLLIFIHEMGHFLFARLFKIRVDKFYLFFNPSFSILRAKRINGKWQLRWLSAAAPDSWKQYPEKTEWGIGWIPLGGYCKIAGMIDESMDKEQLKQPPQPWEFRTHPAWQRMFVMVGGVLFNVVFAALIYWGTLFAWGEQYLANKDVHYGVQCDSLTQEIGFRNGDRILYLDGNPVDRYADLYEKLIYAKSATVIRHSDTLTFAVDDRFLEPLVALKAFPFDLRVPFVVGAIPDSSHNAAAGLKVGDRIVGIDTLPLFIFQDVQAALLDYKNQTVNFAVSRGDSLLTIPLAVNGSGKIGVLQGGTLNDFFPLVTKKYNFVSALPAGVKKGYQTIESYVKSLKLLFTPKAKALDQVGSFITIANIFPGQWSWPAFWNISAMLTVMLAVINILPIPGLDGGHLMFVLYELITRRKPGEKFMEIATWIGFGLLLLIMIFALKNDVVRFIL